MPEPTEPKKIDFAIGGQALIEGVMMRSPNFICIAVRKPDGGIAIKKDPFISVSKKIKILKLPVLRGIANLFEMIIIGMNAINFSVQESLGEEKENETAAGKTSGKKSKTSEKTKTAAKKIFETVSFAISIIISIALALFLFKFIPLFATTQLEKIFPALEKSYLYFNIMDGTIRIAIFIGYVAILSLLPSFKRVFQYHGAEHQAVFTYEKGGRLTVQNVKKEHPEHPRCGTSFIVIVFLIAVFIFSLLPRLDDFWRNLGLRLLIIPLIAGVAYEILKWSAKHQNHRLMKIISAPGLWIQKITAKKPHDEKQIEIAIAALKGALHLEREKRLTLKLAESNGIKNKSLQQKELYR